MQPPFKPLLLLCIVSAGFLFAGAATTLRSGATEITVDAGATSPRLTRLCLDRASCWTQETGEELIATIQSGSDEKALKWKWNKNASLASSRSVRFVYDGSSSDGKRLLQVSWEWQVRGTQQGGPIEHVIRIRNQSKVGYWISLQPSAQMNWLIPDGAPLEQMWVEKGAGGPSNEGVHRTQIDNRFEWTGTSSTYAHPSASAQREMIPYLVVLRPDIKIGWYMGIEFSGRTEINLLRYANGLKVTAGLNPVPGPFRTYLAPGESFITPTVFVGAFHGNEDDAANILRRWVRTVLNDSRVVRDQKYPLVVNNSWGSGMAVNAKQAHAMIQDAAALGFEMFHLDAGWFRGVGDWAPDRTKFPAGLAPIAADAHAHGLRFGLWLDWSQAGFETGDAAISVRDSRTRDWLTTDPAVDYKPLDPFKGVTMDIGDPAVHRWVDNKLHTIIQTDHLDMLEHDGYVVAQGCERTDHPHAPADPGTLRKYVDSGFPFVEGSNSTDVSYHATRAYYEIHDRLSREHPHLLLEICNDGGRMVDFGSAAHGDYFSISDAYDPPSNRRAFYDSSYVLPPAMLETYVEKWPAPSMENFLYGLRSGMMGWFTLMMDTRAFTDEQRAATSSAIALYKERLRPLIRNADLFHVSQRPDGSNWDGVEYVTPNHHNGVLFAFRGSDLQQPAHEFLLRGLNPDKSYKVTFHDRTSADYVVDGEALQSSGLKVNLPSPESSELVFFEEVKP